MNNSAIWRRYPKDSLAKSTIVLYESDHDVLGDADRDLSPELVDFATVVLQDDELIALIPFIPINEAGAMRRYTRRELFGNRIWIVNSNTRTFGSS
ncbi:hypothetical protein SPRG_18319 [Saprolegnia parasitica CBS 223.65]|uniref:Uncharacterized protein n=1 Tax=Saprolegnia parasitica (strain CBS 223.65) TaxID=695850 RepID=A0A067BCS6_SAPPC|nr:hypothetical protein SPRG_18319 [Saprolegnia parasitica CBS 223.65]KDO16144.1 hypothetical protein SPRG_18319 [Saprolegnia parasitica CBS 223.65]|eukprot:XP_012213147.1 hypothetical protein SPRG_18319 [Saprolegnia parasitica CBS 223.65]